MIDEATRIQIEKLLGSLLDGFLAKYDPAEPKFQLALEKIPGVRGELKPFHEALLTPAISKASTYERSFSTTLGSMFEMTAEHIAKSNFAFGKRQYELSARMGTAASTAIESIRNEIETTKMQGRYLTYVDAVAGSFHADTTVRTIKVDLYVRDADENEMFFEMKSPKPNKSQCLDVTEKLLRIHALRQEGPPKVKTYYAMSYNPYGSLDQYNHSLATSLLDMEDQVLLGHEFWDVIGGQGTYDEVVELFLRVGGRFRSEVRRILAS